MKMVKKTFYSNAERANQLTSEAIRKMERGTTMQVRIMPNGRTCLKTNSPAVLEIFQTKIFDFTDKKRDEND
ncbi:hypothetical protein [Dialister hominis]|uniref:hypothetical protein n=1 Tax=Dialister hominis TaxID=2582419 RepID=UPI003FED4EF6